jgi:hypothetical protein
VTESGDGISAGPIAEKTRAQQIIQLFASIGFLAVLVVPSDPQKSASLRRSASGHSSVYFNRPWHISRPDVLETCIADLRR